VNVWLPISAKTKACHVKGWSSPEYKGINPEGRKWLGLRCDNLVVIDCDKPGVEGWWLERIQKPFEHTYTVKTTNGFHFYYSYTPGSPTSSSIGKLHPTGGIDIKAGRGSLVVVPPSPGKEELLDLPILPFDYHWLIGTPIDTTLGKVRQEAVGGWTEVPHGRGNDLMISFAGSFRKQDMAEDAIEACLAAISPIIMSSDPMSLKDIGSVAHSAAQYTPSPDGDIEILEEGTDDVDDETPFDPDQDILLEGYHIDENGHVQPDDETVLEQELMQVVKKQRTMNMARLLDLPDPTWFIEDLIPEAPLTVLHGKGGTRKSFLMLDWMLCAATSNDWQGRHVVPGSVLYIAAEGLMGLKQRVRAWNTLHPEIDLAEIKDFLWMAMPLRLFSAKAEMLEQWRTFMKVMEFKYIVVDTLHRNAAGAEENSSGDMGLVFENAQKIAGKAHLFFLHHDPKDQKVHGPRGTSAIHDDADVVVALEKEKGTKLISILKPEKLKDAEDFDELTIEFGRVDTGNDTSSLCITAISNEIVLDTDKPKKLKDPEAAPAARCLHAILEHGLSKELSTRKMYEALSELGEGFSMNAVVEAVRKRKAGSY
jgi:hypothetical protein